MLPDPYNVIPTIEAVAAQNGVDPLLAVAIAYHESSLNPHNVGDNGTSFGLYQLHEGGELGSMSEQQAFDPVQNASVALRKVGEVEARYPSWSPGHIAAHAQLPANQGAYANAINTIYNQLQADGMQTSNTNTGQTVFERVFNVSGIASTVSSDLAHGRDIVNKEVANGLTFGLYSNADALLKNLGPLAIGIGLFLVGGALLTFAWGEDLVKALTPAVKTAATVAAKVIE